jgi:hypothetical protein
MRAQMIAGLALLAAAHGGCSKWRSHGAGWLEERPECRAYNCSYVGDDDMRPDRILGADLRVRSVGTPCVLTVAWSFWQGPVYAFQAKLPLQKRDVFPSRYGLVDLDGCAHADPLGRPGDERPIPHDAFVFRDQSWLPTDLALADDDVYIPLKGEASLDSGWVATAQLVGGGSDGGAVAATIAVAHRSEPPVVHPALRVGDAFPWSDREATLVRIVEPRPPHVTGWIEVKVVSPVADSD